jgi:hypothetical protein
VRAHDLALAAALALLAGCRHPALLDAGAVARGRAIFADRTVGIVANRQLVSGPGRLMVAPIDQALPDRVLVRCADCHNVAVLADQPPRPVASSPPPFGRCGHCHHAHDRLPEIANRAATGRPVERVPIEQLAPIAANGEVAFCGRCHERHRPFGPVGVGPGRSLGQSGPELIPVPALAGLRGRGPLLRDRSAPSLRALLEARPPRPGFDHRFGIGLGRDEKDDLVAFLQSI